ncbi:SsrA-binding protein SmpB [Anatilimnocola floriformis]|uniref:SsrA-binding protein SmpB n=1 Tax=Anatilimnocola floriformis TaxID=2948575 RepID=UPI0020C44DD3|nr:SsrA-binding protein SmpB [Anatilimnocola floriformis]
MGKGQPKPTKPPPTKAKAAKAAGKTPAKKAAPKEPEGKVVSDNRKARFRFEIVETLECGVQLLGSEVKSLRDGKLSLDEAYARVKDGDVWLVGADIAEYKQATLWNHAPKRPRKLLMHAVEKIKFAGQAHEKGLTLVPLKVYFNARGIAKVLLGLCRGKKLHDKRETLKKNDARRDMDRAMRRR